MSTFADSYAKQLYAQVPGHYRYYDGERREPLLALLRVIAEQVGNIHQDLYALWDNFFIETCADWAVPYIGALVGANLLPNNVDGANRLVVWNTARWRQSRGTVPTLLGMAGVSTGWPVDLVEFFDNLAWSQQTNHVQPLRALTPNLRDPSTLQLLGSARDPFAHAADLRTGQALGQAPLGHVADPVTRGMHPVPITRAAWGTTGRYAIGNIGIFVRRLQTYVLQGVTPAGAPPGEETPPDEACFTFDPLHRLAPLFMAKSRQPLTRGALNTSPWEIFGADVAVRHHGVLAATTPLPQGAGGEVPVAPSEPGKPFTFGAPREALRLHERVGMRLMDPHAFQLGAAHFIIVAEWIEGDRTAPIELGTLSTLHASLREHEFYRGGRTVHRPGRLAIRIETGRPMAGWEGLPSAGAAYFPGAVLAVRAAESGPVRADDALYIYLPGRYITPHHPRTFYVAADGSTYTEANLAVSALARASEGQIYPPYRGRPSVMPAGMSARLNRGRGGVRVVDEARFGESSETRAAVLIQMVSVDAATQRPHVLGAVATVDQQAAAHPQLDVTGEWPAFTYATAKASVESALPEGGLLAIGIQSLSPGTPVMPQTELVVTNRDGRTLLVYLPETHLMTSPPSQVLLLVADDGSTYQPPNLAQGNVTLGGQSYASLRLARASAGQVMPITGVWPLQQRVVVGLDLEDCKRRHSLRPGELGIDPEVGRFAFCAGDPLIGASGLSVDYVEAFSAGIGARPFPSATPQIQPTRLVARSGDAVSPLNPGIARDHIHRSVVEAIERAVDGDVIEIMDSATYHSSRGVTVPKRARHLSLRAAPGMRPCLTFYNEEHEPHREHERESRAEHRHESRREHEREHESHREREHEHAARPASLAMTPDIQSLELNGLLISGDPIRIERHGAAQLLLTQCTLVPRETGGSACIVAAAPEAHGGTSGRIALSRCVSGALHVEAQFGLIVIADSIVDGRKGPAIGGVDVRTEHPTPAGQVQLDRVTVLGEIRCGVLEASDSLLDSRALVSEEDSGYIRYSRFERGSALPQRYRCVPSDAELAQCPPQRRCLAPVFNSRSFGRPDYCQIAADCPEVIKTAAEDGGEIGAFASAQNAARLANLTSVLPSIVPAGFSPVIIAET